MIIFEIAQCDIMISIKMCLVVLQQIYYSSVYKIFCSFARRTYVRYVLIHSILMSFVFKNKSFEQLFYTHDEKPHSLFLFFYYSERQKHGTVRHNH